MTTQTRTLQSPLLVGRDEVLSLLDRRIDEAKAGRGTLLLFAGEAGIGKTRLLWSAIRKAEALGFKADGGSLSPQDALAPLQSIGDMGRSLLSNRAFGDLGADLLSIKAGKGGDALANRRILVHEIADRIVAAVDRPTALAFEDLQWADELSLEVIGELARSAPRLPLLLIADYRLEELPTGSIHREWRSRLLTQRFAEEVRLERLDHDDTALVTTLILGTGLPAPRDVVEAVYQRTNGIPLHIEELLAALGREVDGRTIRDAVVPETIEDAVLARANRLSAEARSVARAGAILGRCFNPEALAGVMNRRPEDLDDALEELVGAAVLHPFEYVDQGYYDFRHQLLRDALYHSVPAAERRRLHSRAAEFGKELAGASEVHASVHYERAGNRADAFRAALAGAEAAAAMTSRFEAFELYRRAIANIPDGLPASELGDLYNAYCSAGFAVDDVAAIEEGATLARRYYLDAGRAVDAASTLIALSAHARRDVRPRTERQAFLDQAEAELAAIPPSPERTAALADVRFMQAVLQLDGVRLPEARALLLETLELKTAAAADASNGVALPYLDGIEVRPAKADVLPGHPPVDDTRLDIEHALAWADALGGDIQGGLARMLELSRQARAAQFEGTGVTNYRISADVAVRLMQYPTATIGVTEGLRYADEVEQSYCRHVMAATSAHVAWAAGRWDEALAQAGIELVEPGSRRGTLGSRTALAFVAFGRGEVDKARELLDTALAISRPSGEIDLVLPALWGLAETALVAGDPARAFDHCQEALELAAATAERALLAPFVVTGVRAALAARRPEAAERWLARITRLLAGWEDHARPALDHADGLVRLAAGSTTTARSSLEAAINGWDGRGRIWEASWARLDLGTCLVRANRYADALVILDQVRKTAAELVSAPLLERADEVARLARSRGGEVEPWYPLSAREFEVAQKIAEGLTNAEIGIELFVSPKTVSAHVEHILAKLKVSRRAEIAAWVATVRPSSAGEHMTGEAPAAVATA
jgi:DNA-binding CsgD family transcriptional regulator/tetratricopeptide (TPR) repeat protein